MSNSNHAVRDAPSDSVGDATRSDFHTIVIGAGSGGLTAAVGLGRMGKRVALIERGPIGGDCTNVGCIPSKTLIHAVEQKPDEPARDVLAYVRERRDALREEETEWAENGEEFALVRGYARFVAPHAVEVTAADGGARRYSAQHFVIATGSRPRRLEIPGLPDARLLTNESLFEIDDAPAHLAIVGAGRIGCEMAFAFRRLGSRVTVVESSERVLGDVDPEAGEVVGRRMERAGIPLHLNATPEAWTESTRTLSIHRSIRRGGDLVDIHDVDRVLMAVGRIPNTDLDLPRAGIEAGPHGIGTNAAHRTNVRHIYAIGDVTPDGGTTHQANAHGRAVVRQIAIPWVPPGPAPTIPAVVFCEPEVARAGPPLTELASRYAPELIRTLRVDLADTDRGYTMGLEEGFLQLHAMRLTGRVLSATIVAPGAGEMIPLLTLVIQRRIPLWSLTRLVIPYPVLSEAVKQSADDFVFPTLASIGSEAATYARHRWRRPSRP